MWLLRFVVLTTALTSLQTPARASSTGRYTLQRGKGTGNWSLVSPEGTPVFLLALNHLAAPYYIDIIQGASGLYPCHSYDVNCLKQDLFRAKYYSNWSLATADFVANSKLWGFNSAGYEFIPSPGLSWPYIPDLFVTNSSHIFARSGHGATFADVFDPDWAAQTDRRVRDWIQTDQHINHPRVLRDVVGYYFEDQPIWNITQARSGRTSTAPGAATDWVAATRALTATCPGKITYVDWLQEHYNTRGGFERMRQVYKAPSTINKWIDLRHWDFTGFDTLDADVVADDNDFLAVVAEQYFAVSAGAVRRHDPGALVFGQRFIGQDAPPVVLAAAGRHFDIISVQPSPFSFSSDSVAELSAETLARFSQLAGDAPVFVADQATHFPEPSPSPPNCQPKHGGCAQNETQAGELYRAYLKDLRSVAATVGYSHCQYIDRAVRSGGSTQVTLKQGLLKFDGTSHFILTSAVTRANHDFAAGYTAQ